jgi:hypothetical protein
MNYDDLDGVEKLKKFELGIQIPTDVLTKINNFINEVGNPLTDRLNPFVDWDVDVEASFTKLGEETSKVIDGFYYREYERNAGNTDWTDLGTNYPFRVRFSPPNTGIYSCIIKIKVSGSVAYTSTSFTFNVIETGAHGYVTVHENQRNLELDGQIIFPIGHNFPYPSVGVHTYDVAYNNTTKAAPPSAWDYYHIQLHNYHDIGGKYVRVSQGAPSSLIEFEKKGNYYDRLHYAWETDAYIEYCENNGMMLNFNMLFQEPLMSYGQIYTQFWDFTKYVYNYDSNSHDFNPLDPYPTYCYNDNPTVENADTPDKMFTDESDLIYHEQRMRYYISRYGYSTSIMQFEFLSEAFHLGQKWPEGSFEAENSNRGETLRIAVDNYVMRMSDYIKETMGHTEHLLGHHAFGKTVSKPDAGPDDYSLNHDNIDVIGFSTYDEYPWKYVKNKNNDGIDVELQVGSEEETYYRYTKYFTDTYHKPVMHFEEGALFSWDPEARYPDDCSNTAVHKINAPSVGFTGNTGYFAWQGWNDYESDRWPITIAAEKWMNSEFVINVLSAYNGEWNQGRQAEKITLFGDDKLKETQYYVDLSQENAVGYVYNRTYNYYTQGPSVGGSLCTQSIPPVNSRLHEFENEINFTWNAGPNLRVKGLQSNSDYLVKWYDRMGNYISEECYSTGLDNNLKLKHPDLIADRNDDSENVPLILYTIEKHNCQLQVMENPETASEKRNQLRMVEDNLVPGTSTLFPNPFTEKITFISLENSGFSILDSKNQLVYSGQVKPGSNEIDLNSLSKGIYFLKLDFSNEVFKLIKQ